MPQRVPYGLEGDPLAQQPNGEGMAQAISPLGRNIQATASNPMVEDVVDACGVQWAEWSEHAKEQFAPWTRSATFFQVVLEDVPDFIGQWQNQVLVSFALADSQNSGSPVNIVQCQCNHFAVAQPVSRLEKEHGVVAEPMRFTAINGPEQGLDLGPRKRSRQSF